MTNYDEKLCPRCGVGIDDDGDGNCAFCANYNSSNFIYIIKMWKDRVRVAESELAVFKEANRIGVLVKELFEELKKS